MSHDCYENPLVTRYASASMSQLWSEKKKIQTWRRLWVALAEAESELGLPISKEQLDELHDQAAHIDFRKAATYERQLRHDVMAHVHTYGDSCPTARAIIHLGATSAFITDNTDLILLREALRMIIDRLATVIDRLAQFAELHRNVATLGFTHLQPAQPTTVGKRACLWAYDLVQDLLEAEHRWKKLKARSTMGTTGTQASFLCLFQGNHDKVRQLQQRVAEKMGFEETYAVTGQTYPRKVDMQVIDVLVGIAASAHKAATDLRLLAHRKELEEPVETHQIGSSAMAYKRNPMRCERMCSLARYVLSLQSNAAQTLATQWLERTLDDSANRRLVLPQSLLSVDAILCLYQNIAEGLVIYPEVITRNLNEEIPFLASENILMTSVSAGGDRQKLHERIRQHSRDIAVNVKKHGGKNNLLERLAADKAFTGIDVQQASNIQQLVGRAPQQVDEFLADVVQPIRSQYQRVLQADVDLRV